MLVQVIALLVFIIGRRSFYSRQMAQIVQHGGHHSGVFFASLLCQMRPLHRMFKLAYGFSTVLSLCAGLKNFDDVSRCQ